MYLTTRDRANVMLSTASLRDFFMEMSLPRWIISYVIMAAGNLPQLIEYSAIPILIFLAGLQSVPGQLYECAKLEGATGWETFWKITFPLISPLFLTNVIFIIVTRLLPGNQLVSYISDLGRGIFGVSVAMSLMYFAAIS